MLNRPALLVLYYFGFGFVVFLSWCIAVHQLNQGIEPEAFPRLRRLVALAAVAGLVHPAFALAARDVARQLRVDAPSSDLAPTPQRIRSINALIVVSLLLAPLLVMVVT